MKPLIISLAVNGRECYTVLQKDLINSLNVVRDCDTIILNSYPQGVTPHSDIPYLFKFDIIKMAVAQGYRQIFWLDSTMRLLKDPFELLEQSETGIVAFHNVGHKLFPRYISTLATVNLSDFYTDIESIESTWGGALGFNFDKEIPNKIMEELYVQAQKGSFYDSGSAREGFVAHRHDQSILSVLFNYYKVPLLEYGLIAASPDVTDKTYIRYGNEVLPE